MKIPESSEANIDQAERRMIDHDVPHFVQYRRSLMSLLLCRPKNSAPLVMLTFSFFHNVNALTGAAE